MIKILPVMILALVAAPAACGKKKEPADSGAKVEATKKVAVETADANSDACKVDALRASAMDSGTKVMGGVTTDSSVTLAKLSESPAEYKGKTVRIEGKIVDVCAKAGCFLALDDGSGQQINLKVTDGVIDFRQLAVAGQYAVGEGTYMRMGPHGAQVQITGAMIGKTVCK